MESFKPTNRNPPGQRRASKQKRKFRERNLGDYIVCNTFLFVNPTQKPFQRV